MKVLKKLTPAVAALSLAAAALITPIAAQAEMSASMAFSNMYLWRGQNVGNSGGAISGSLDYSDAGGLYAGIWTSSEKDGSETDIYIGFSTEVAPGVGVDVSYWNYIYPEDGGVGPGTGISDKDAAEIVLGVSYMDFSFGYYTQVDSDNPDDDYITLGYGFGKYSLTYGMWSRENSKTSDEYSHITLSYAATDDLSMTVSKLSSDNNATEEDPLFQITYSKSFDLK